MNVYLEYFQVYNTFRNLYHAVFKL